jgi:hypothetical protein
VPENLRGEMQSWGPAKDEFTDTGGWPHQMYVREARRMVSDYVMTEHNCRGKVTVEDPVSLAAYTMDSHNCQRLAKNGRAENEGDVQVGGFPPYPIAYRSIIPRAIECENLLVPICHSATHIAYGSIRMEPVFMILGQSAATAAALALDAKVSLQKLPYEKLRSRLLADKQILAWTGTTRQRAAADTSQLKGILVDDEDAVKTGQWTASLNVEARRAGTGYVHDDNTDKGHASITFTPELPAAGAYELILVFPPHPNRATRVPVTVAVRGGGTNTLFVNQRDPATKGFVSLGKFILPKGKGASVTVSNRDTDGYVVADAAQFLPAG